MDVWLQQKLLLYIYLKIISTAPDVRAREWSWKLLTSRHACLVCLGSEGPDASFGPTSHKNLHVNTIIS